MKIYLDLVFFLNFVFDFLLLMTVSLVLKRNIKLRRLFLGALVGGLSIFFLFIPLNNITLFLLKFLISFLMILITFKFKNLKYTATNMLYLYIASIMLGGFLYLLNIEFSYKNEGLIFFHNGLSINFIVLIIISPIILYIYIKSNKHLKLEVSNYHQVDLYLDTGEVIKCNGYLDTGNCLYDPYHHRPIILLHSKKVKFDYENGLLVPFKTLNNNGLIKCITIPKLVIDKNIEHLNVLVGLSRDDFKIEGIDLILHKELMEGK